MAASTFLAWLHKQQGDDLQPISAFHGLIGEVIVRIPSPGIGTVQFTDPNGAVIVDSTDQHATVSESSI